MTPASPVTGVTDVTHLRCVSRHVTLPSLRGRDNRDKCHGLSRMSRLSRSLGWLWCRGWRAVHRPPIGAQVAMGVGFDAVAGERGQRLPNRLNVEHDGIRYTAGVGRFADGGVAKIFPNIAKHGTALDVNARAAAVAPSPAGTASLSSRHTLRQAVTRNSDGSGSGPLARALDLLVE